MIIFLDLETTGLDPVKDHILQIAMQAYDGGATRPVGDPFVMDCALTEGAAGRLYTNPFVRDMHRKTGLLDRLEAAIVRYPHTHNAGVEVSALTYLDALDGEKHTLAGNSVHFDLAFLRQHMPALAARFSHRLLDISVLRMFEDQWGSGKIDVDNGNEHDALADVKCSIAQFEAYVARRRDLTAAVAVRDQVRA